MDRMREVVLVIGPPCAGKSMYVEERKQPGDVVVDLDLIAQELGSPVAHDHPARFLELAARVRDQREAQVAQAADVRAWVIRVAGRPSTRERLERRLRPVRTVVVNPGPQVCMSRAREAGRSPATLSAIVQWFQEFDAGLNGPQARRKGRR